MPINRIDQAIALLDPLRLGVMAAARQPSSAADIARDLGLPRQRVNYHVRALAKAGLLRRAGRRLKRNLAEQRYEATARAYVLLPELLGPLAADASRAQDTFSASYLLANAARMQTEMAQAEGQAAAQGRRTSPVTLDAAIHFESADQHRVFTQRLELALIDVIAQYTVPANAAKAGNRPYRLLLNCYPLPQPETDPSFEPKLKENPTP